MDDVVALHTKEGSQKAAEATWPPPEVRNRPLALNDPLVPKNARALAQKGAAYKITYSRGPVATRSGYRIVDCIIVRAIAGQRKLVAVYHDGSFKTAFAHGVEGRVGAKVAKEYLTEDVVDVTWLPRYAWLPRH